MPGPTTLSPPSASFNEGMRLHRAGRIEDAVRIYQKILKTEPGHYGTLYHLGVALWQQGKAQKALPFASRAVRVRPQDASPYNSLGLIQTSLQDHRKAEQSFEAALRLQPSYAEAWFNLARLYLVEADWKKLLSACGRLLELRPNDMPGKIMRAVALAELGRFYALNIDELTRSPPDNPYSATLIARACYKSGDTQRALRFYDHALALDPKSLIALQGKAAALIESGRNDDARQTLAILLQHYPGTASALRLLATIHKFTVDDDVSKDIRKALAVKELAGEQKAELYFALAKYHGDTGAPAEAFALWQKAGTIRSRLKPFDFERYEKKVAALENMHPERVAMPEVRAAETVPLFIIGMPRSGTTLMEQILAAHPEVRAGGELFFFRNAVAPATGLDGADPQKLAAALEQGGRDYARWIGQLAQGARYVTDKMPYNFRYAGFVPAMLPQAKVIHMVRHPLDTCLSCFGLLFNSGHEWSYDLRALGKYYRIYHEMMQHWRSVMPEGAILDLRYEALAADQEAEARKALDYCGLAWDDSCLRFYESDATVKTASAQQVRRPAYTSSIGRWKIYEQELAPLAEELAPVIKQLGYES